MRRVKLNPNQEITIHLKKIQRKLCDVDNQHDEVCREINELSVEDAHLAEYSKKLEFRIHTCKHLLAEHTEYLKARSNREITIHLRTFKREKSGVNARRSDIGRNIEQFKLKADNLLDQSHEYESRIEICQRALAGDPVLIWAEIQRFES